MEEGGSRPWAKKETLTMARVISDQIEEGEEKKKGKKKKRKRKP